MTKRQGRAARALALQVGIALVSCKAFTVTRKYLLAQENVFMILIFMCIFIVIFDPGGNLGIFLIPESKKSFTKILE